jgi:hypothetical protein
VNSTALAYPPQPRRHARGSLDGRNTCLYRQPGHSARRLTAGRGESLRTALALVLQALGAEVVFRSIPVTGNDRIAGGEIIRPQITEKLQVIVAELDARATASAAA